MRSGSGKFEIYGADLARKGEQTPREHWCYHGRRTDHGNPSAAYNLGPVLLLVGFLRPASAGVRLGSTSAGRRLWVLWRSNMAGILPAVRFTARGSIPSSPLPWYSSRSQIKAKASLQSHYKNADEMDSA